MVTSVHPVADSPPATIQLGALAIAAGVAGHSVALYYQGFPGSLLGGVWRYHAATLRSKQVLEIHRGRELKQVRRAAEDLRLVLVTDPTLRCAIAWQLALDRREANAAIQSCPALFSTHGNRDPEDEPGATLVLHGHPEELAAVTGFLQAQNGKSPDSFQPGVPQDVQFHPALQEPLSSGKLCYRDEAVVRGLLVGAARVRQTAASALTVTPADYSAVYELLQQRSVRPVDESADPLAVAMVKRANVYLAWQHSLAEQIQQPRIRHPNTTSGGPNDDERIITRRVLADLGDPRSRLVRQLINHLLARPDGLSVFRSLGLAVRLETSADWPSRQPDALGLMLQAWSPKQIRNHFHRLHTEGLINGGRRSANAPWQYQLPEILQHRQPAWRKLPAPAEVQALADEIRLPAAGPTGAADQTPSPASNSEQTTAE